MVPPASNLALAPPAYAPVPLPAKPPRRDVSWQLTALHERHAAELLRFCRWMLRDADDAADALQDTWMRAMSALAEDRVSVTSMRPWLYAIARNACLDRLRERKRASRHELDESALGDAPGADEVAGLRNEARAALALIGTLSERQRSALLMREVAGMSVPEIAEALGLTAERAQWTIADARRALEDSDGRALECAAARDRLDRGARGRALRAHLSVCDECRAHDRAMRARRVLAPALLPFVWLRRALHALAPAAHPAAVAMVAAAVALPHGVEHRRAPVPAAATPHRVAPAAASPAAAPLRLAAPSPSTDRHRGDGVRRPAAHRPVASPPAARPTTVDAVHPPMGGSSASTVPAVPVVQAVAETVKRPVAQVLDRVDDTAAVVPAAAPVVHEATAVVRQVVAGL